MQILNALAALYRGQSADSVSSLVASSERRLWPIDLKPHLEAASQETGSLSHSDAGPDSQEVCMPGNSPINMCNILCAWDALLRAGGDVAVACRFSNAAKEADKGHHPCQ